MTVREISSITGLSPATVYRILKDPSNVTRKSYEKVQRIIGDIKGKPEKLQQVYIILPHMNSFYTIFLMEALSLLRKQGIAAIPFITEENQKAERDFIKQISFSQRIGLIWNPTDPLAQFPFMSRRKNKPVVLSLNRSFSHYEPELSITLGNHEALYKIVNTISQKKYKKVLFINGPEIYSTARERLNGFLEAIKQYDDIQWKVLTSDYYEWKNTYLLLMSDPSLLSHYDAIISANESISYGILKACKELKISIPDDLYFIGIDYAPVFEALSLPMAYFSPQKIAQKAVKLLVQKSINRNLVIHQKFDVQVQIFDDIF